MIRPLGINTVRRQAEIMETETRRFYERAAGKVSDVSTRKLLGDLAEAERKHVTLADNLQQEYLTPDVKAQEEKAHRRLFVLQIVQPGLAGLMDGSVSTLAPVFAAAFATHSSHAAFVVGLAASIGAGISMAFAEAASDDGSISSDCWRSVGLFGWDLDRKLLSLLTRRPAIPTAWRVRPGVDRVFRSPQQCRCRSPRRENQKTPHRVAA